MFAVTLAAAIVLAVIPLMSQGPIIQYGGKVKVDKGPRAIGLIQLPSKGKARLIPIAIMMDGKFYDADSFKASPVPMALDFGVVYEAFHTGVSQGIFTITQPGQLNHTWIAEGTWLNAGAVAQQKKKKYTPPVIEDEDSNRPPVLHRRKQASDADDKSKDDKSKDKGAQTKSADSKDAGTTAAGTSDSKNTDTDKNKTSSEKGQAPNQQGQGKEKDQASKDQASKDEQKSGSKEASPSGSTPPPAATSGTASGANAAKKPAESASASDEQIEDPSRPRLRRGQPPDASTRRDVYAKFEPLPNPVTASLSSDNGKSDAGKSDGSKGREPGALAQVTTFPAISDVGGPDPRPYVYDVKPVEEAIYRNKMLDLAAAQFHAHSVAAKDATSASTKSSTTKTSETKPTTTKTARKSAAKLAKPDFDNVTLHIFDLSNSNQPVLVLSATARPAVSGTSENVAEPKEIVLIARTNLEGDLKKLFFSQTDSRHLDETPRMELIDAVDADGDGRGELLFRRTFDNGSAYSIYRVTADRLWPLYEGTP
jgi:hypothetical protein